jgi:type IV pilus assembly protein PilC
MYQYEAVDKNGLRVAGVLDLANETAAEQTLWQQGLTIVRLAPAKPKQTLSTLFPTFFGVKRRDLIIFSRQLSTLLESGINILAGLRLLTDQASSRALRQVLEEVISALQQGQSFSTALAAHPLAFPPLYARTVTIGEHTGHLEESLRQLATYYEKEQALSRKIRDALAYPIFVMIVAVFVVIIMMTVALPPIVSLFETFSATLPLPTRILIAISKFASTYGVYVLFIALVLTAVSAWWGGTPSGQRVRDTVLLRVPALSQVILYGQIARFTRTASVLVRAGLPLPEVMELTLQAMDNVVVFDALERVRVALLAGQGFAVPLSSERIFPAMLGQMARVGEETGTLDGNLATLADFYEEDVDRRIKTLTSLAEPALTLLVGGVVGFIAISMVLPMYSILSSIK